MVEDGTAPRGQGGDAIKRARYAPGRGHLPDADDLHVAPVPGEPPAPLSPARRRAWLIGLLLLALLESFLLGCWVSRAVLPGGVLALWWPWP